MSAPRAPRIGLIGARRARQGLGPYVARDLHALGLQVVAVLGTSEATAGEAARHLAEAYGIRAEPYTDRERMLAGASLDAIAVLSPPASHEAHLEAALASGLHVLCEKPLLWGGAALSARGAALVEGFRSRGLLLFENCQWPFTLPAFRALHPDAPPGPPSRFAMRLSPTRSGLELIGDSLPHPVSMLQALAPDPGAQVGEIRVEALSPAREDADLRFTYRAAGGAVACEVVLRHGHSQPREASYSLDGRRAARALSLPAYTMELRDGKRSVPLPDPVTACLREFAVTLGEVLAGAVPPDPWPSAQRLQMLACLLKASQEALGDPAQSPPA